MLNQPSLWKFCRYINYFSGSFWHTYLSVHMYWQWSEIYQANPEKALIGRGSVGAIAAPPPPLATLMERSIYILYCFCLQPNNNEVLYKSCVFISVIMRGSCVATGIFFEYFGKNTGLWCTILQYICHVLFRQTLKRTSGRGYVKDSGNFLKKKRIK